MNSTANQRVIEFSGFRLDARQRLLFSSDGESVPLTSRAFDTLLYMVDHPGDLLDRDALMRAVWPNSIVEENNLDQCIAAVRRALGETREDHKFIVTIPGRGYRFVAPVKSDREKIASSRPAAKPLRRRLYWLGGVGATLLVLVFGYILLNQQSRPKKEVTVRAISIAVLPFKNLSPDPKDAYFAAGLHDEVLNQLAKIHSMNVIARSSVMQYAKETKPIPEVARELHVGSVMEGSVQFANDRVKLTAHLVDGKTGTDLWSEAYERPLGDIFKIEADIAMNVANALQAKFSPEEQARIQKQITTSPEAYVLWLQANAAVGYGDANKAISLFQRAISIDPHFAHAYGLMALIQASTLINSTSGNAILGKRRAALEAISRKNAERAIEIDPDVPFAHTALAMPALTKWHWTEADKSFALALQAAPNDNTARQLYGYLLVWMGRPDEAIAVAKRAVELNPTNPNAGQYGLQLAIAGRHGEAIKVLKRTLSVQAGNLLARSWLAWMEIAKGKPSAAIQQLEVSERLVAAIHAPPFVYLPEWAYLYGRAGRPADAKRLFDQIKAAADKGAKPGAGGWAMAYLAIGDESHALEWLKKGAQEAANHEPDQGFFALMNLRTNPTNNPVLKKPEFADVLSRIKGD